MSENNKKVQILDFEKPIYTIQDKIEELKQTSKDTHINYDDEIKKLEGLWDIDLLMVNKSDGSITVLDRYNNEYVKVLTNNLHPSFQLIEVPEDCEYIYLIFGDDTIYSLKVQLSAAEEAPAA